MKLDIDKIDNKISCRPTPEWNLPITLERIPVKTIVFTLGFDVTSVIARLSEIGLEGVEHLVFITLANSSPRALSTQKTLESHITILNARGLKLTFEFLAVEEDDAAKAVAKIYNVLAQYDHIYTELSGGLRYLIIVTFLAVMILRGRVKEVTTRLESDGRRLLIPLFEPRPLPTPDAKVLQELRRVGPRSQKQLATSVRRKVSNISRTLTRLEKLGFVKSSGSHPINYGITPLGEVFLQDYATNKSRSNSRLAVIGEPGEVAS